MPRLKKVQNKSAQMKSLKDIYSVKNSWAHKGARGYVFILGGSKKYSGSPVFNAFSALRSGADLTVCAGPERAMNIAASFSPDIITHPLAGDFFKSKDVSFVLRTSEKFDSMILGCGLGAAPETMKAVQGLIGGTQKPMVIDADGIRALAGRKEIIRKRPAVITPNIAEFEILTGEKVRMEVNNRKEKVKKWAERLNCVILLKGKIDVISDGKETILNKTGSCCMTKGGFGDTLSGILGAILARKVSLLRAAEAASFINGKAGEMAAKQYGEGVVASDVFDFIPQVIKKFQ